MSAVRAALAQKVQGKKVLVFGLGRQGGAKVANRLHELGAYVRVSDAQTQGQLAQSVAELDPAIKLSLGDQKATDIEWAEIIVKNPAVPYTHPLMVLAEEQGKVVTSETALALAPVRDRSIGVTGTRGKTTTSQLIFEILKQAGWKVLLGGNQPQRPTLDVVLTAEDDAWFVFELSSFQLESLDRERISPHIAVLTSLSPDHLNRYETMENYVSAKASIFRWQVAGDSAFFWKGSEWDELIRASIQSGVKSQALSFSEVAEVSQAFSFAVPGEHNKRNGTLAVKVARSLEIDDEVIARAVADFSGVPYRQQVLATNDGIIWINDTTATTPTALLTALETQGQTPFILITGGTTKHLPFPDLLISKLQQMSENIVWLAGSGTNELWEAIGAKNQKAHEKMLDAVQAARSLSQEKGTPRVLLSPGFSSFEHFQNEFDRGDQFNVSVTSK